MYQRKGSQGYWIWRALSDKIQQGSGGPQGIWCEHRYSTRRRTNARGSDYRDNWLTQSSIAQELWIPSQGIRSNVWLGMDKLNSLRGTFDDHLIGWEPARAKNDGWAGKIIHKDQLIIEGIRNILNQRTQNDNDKGCQSRLLDIWN